MNYFHMAFYTPLRDQLNLCGVHVNYPSKRHFHSMEHNLIIVKRILDANPHSLLSGSLALSLQGISLDRYLTDIDIWMPRNIEFRPIHGMDFADSGWWYPRGSHLVLSFIYQDDANENPLFIDIFKAREEHYCAPNSININGIRMVLPVDILKFKLEHAMATNESDNKHAQDLIRMHQAKIRNSSS